MRQTRENGLKRFLKPALRFVVSFGLIGIIFYVFRAQLPAVLEQLKNVKIPYFVTALAVFYAGILAVAFRLRSVFRVHDTELPVATAYYVNVVALFFNNVLPSSVGGEMVKAYYLYNHSGGKVTSFSGVIVDRLFGLATTVLIGISAILFFDKAIESPKILSSILTMTGVTVVVMIVIFNRRIVNSLTSLQVPFIPAMLLEKLREIYQAMYYYRGHKYIVGNCFLLTFIGQTSFILVNYLLAISLGIDVPLGFFFFFGPILLIMGLAPSVNGIGVREATFLFYLTEFTTADKALALSLLTTFFMILTGVIGGIIYAFKGGVPAAGALVDPD